MGIPFSAYYRLMRLHQPTGSWLLLWPALWGIALATSTNYPDFYLMAIFLIGSFAMRSAGCIVNDIVDRKIDPYVERTRMRPLASGELKVYQATLCLMLLLLIGLWVLFQLNMIAIFLALFSCLFVVIYPFMKRIMQWPQLFLGLTFNFGALVGWAAASDGQGHIGLPAFLLYIACYFWTLGYDTIYALQDKKDDVKIGVKSTAVSMQQHVKKYVVLFYCAMTILMAVVGFYSFGYVGIYYTVALMVAFAHLMWQILSLDSDDPRDCMQKFKSNMYFGWIIFCGILAEKWFIV